MARFCFDTLSVAGLMSPADGLGAAWRGGARCCAGARLGGGLLAGRVAVGQQAVVLRAASDDFDYGQHKREGYDAEQQRGH